MVKLSVEIEIVGKFPFFCVLHLTRIPNTEELIVLTAKGFYSRIDIYIDFLYGVDVI